MHDALPRPSVQSCTERPVVSRKFLKLVIDPQADSRCDWGLGITDSTATQALLAHRRRKEMFMPHPIAYLAFDGNCAEAMRFYESALGAKLEILQSGADSPMAAQIPKEVAHRILHARLALKDGGFLYAGDAPMSMPYQGIHGVSITLNYDSVAEARKVFDNLAAGGKVTMAMQPSYWAKSFGMLVDKFGTPWIVNGELLPM